MNLIFGLIGVKTSGKDTAASFVAKAIKEDNTNVGVVNSAIAGKLKDVCAEVFGITRSHFDDQNIKEVPFNKPIILTLGHVHRILHSFGVNVTQKLSDMYEKAIVGTLLESPRRIAQIVGTEILRNTGDKDIHCKNTPVLVDGVTIITDIRFPNEYAYFSKLSCEGYRFIPLYIQRDEAESKITPDSHPSETSVFLFRDQCIKVPNNGSLEDLEEKMVLMLENEGFIKKKR